ncbi:MAG: response regulator [Myxococcales bacterium]|nr:response regulator [Myxococcales bacterium]
MAQARKILIADPDLESVRALTRALRQRGFQMHYAPDGSKALEVSVLRHPDLILFDDGCRLIDARTFVQILRTNPRTEDIPVVLTSRAFEADKVRVFRDGVLQKPFNIDEVQSRLEQVFRRADAARELRAEAKEIEGHLSQLPIPDLLQILSVNKRSGRLTLSRGSERGEIHVRDGRPVNARLGAVEGEKALFRLVGWTEGTFAFVPGAAPSRVLVDRSMEDALLEGMRQADELSRLTPSLPQKGARLVLSPGAELSTEQHPVTAQVVELLRQPRPLPEILDLAPATDLEVVAALAALLQRGLARVAEGEEEAGRGPLLGTAEVHALKARLFRGRLGGRVGVAKVFLCAGGAKPLREFLRALPDLIPVAAEPRALRSGFGTVGRLELSEVLKLELCVLPPTDAARPLWRPFSSGSAGGLMLDTSEAALQLGRFLGFEVRVPLVVLGHGVPRQLLGAPAGVASVGEEAPEALRLLLLQSLNPVQPELSPERAARGE